MSRETTRFVSSSPDYQDENIVADIKVFVESVSLRQLGEYMKQADCKNGRIVDHQGNILVFAMLKEGTEGLEG